MKQKIEIETENKQKTGGLVMKTNLKSNRNSIQGSILKSLIVVAIIILSATVNGQSYWASNSSDYYKFINTLISKTPKESVELANAAMFENATDDALVIEDWMTDEEYFNVYSGFENATDEPLQVEEWMINEAYFQVTEKDEPLEVESWMVAKNFGSE